MEPATIQNEALPKSQMSRKLNPFNYEILFSRIKKIC